MATILISGGSGLVGRHLCSKLMERGHQVGVLSRTRKQQAGIQTFTWDPENNEIEDGAVETADYIIHLAGANIGEKRWTEERKKLIIDSRVKTAELIFKKVQQSKTKPGAFISASAVGYYGAVTAEKFFSETDPPHDDFLGKTCRLWEEAADRFNELGIRTVKLRTGVVLAREGGALPKMSMPVKIGIGSALGSGNQYFPCIHINDLCGIYIKAVEDDQMRGAYNAAAPEQKSNREFTRTLAKVLKRPFFFPDVPAFVIKIIFGSMAEMFLEGSRVSVNKVAAAGYNFIFPELEDALGDLLKK
jgi:uncharacterized protein (TIGR01777 family)